MKPGRTAQLSAAKLRGLLTGRLGSFDGEPRALGSGAAVLAADQAWVYVPGTPRGTLGAALVWAQREHASEAHLVLDRRDGLLAFAARGFATPTATVWHAAGRVLEPVEPVAPSVQSPPDCNEHLALLSGLGVDVVADHGVWIAEVNGLEVARIGLRDGQRCSIDIGIGAYDQFAAAALADDDEAERIAAVAELVRAHRSADVPPHAIGRLVRARWLRAQAIRHPALLEHDRIDPIPLPYPRPGLVETQPAAALGVDAGGRQSLLMFAVGLDLEAIELAAALAQMHDVDAVTVVVPGRDRHQRLVDAVGALGVPAAVATLEGEWSD